jgi:hypothetical protein
VASPNAGPDWVAVYGAALSTLLMFWEFIQWWNDRSRLSVECYLAKLVNGVVISSGSNMTIDWPNAAGGLPDHLIQRFIAINVKNIGGKPMVISQVAGLFTNGQQILGMGGPIALPHTLEPGASVLLTLPIPMPQTVAGVMTLGHVAELGVRDGLGNLHKAKLKVLKRQYVTWVAATPQNQG